MSFPYLEQQPVQTLTIEEARALGLSNFWDTGLTVEDVYQGTY